MTVMVVGVAVELILAAVGATVPVVVVGEVVVVVEPDVVVVPDGVET
jgi:hypothetical protein